MSRFSDADVLDRIWTTSIKEGLLSMSEFNGDENSNEWEDSDEDVDAQECRSKRVITPIASSKMGRYITISSMKGREAIFMLKRGGCGEGWGASTSLQFYF